LEQWDNILLKTAKVVDDLSGCRFHVVTRLPRKNVN
jgi:hypothetical protein